MAENAPTESPCGGTGLVADRLCPLCGGRTRTHPMCAAAALARRRQLNTAAGLPPDLPNPAALPRGAGAGDYLREVVSALRGESPVPSAVPKEATPATSGTATPATSERTALSLHDAVEQMLRRAGLQ